MANTKARIFFGLFCLLGFSIGFWLITNAKFPSNEWRAGAIFIGMSIASLAFAILENPIARYFGYVVPQDSGPLYIGRQAAVGAILGLALIVSRNTFGLSIGLPQLSLASVQRGVVTVIGAPVVEEPFFRYVILMAVLMSTVGTGFASYLIGALVSPAVFSIYHFAAYGATFAGPAFLGAAIFGFIATLIVFFVAGKKGVGLATIAQVILTLSIMHAMINAAVLYGELSAAGAFSIVSG